MLDAAAWLTAALVLGLGAVVQSAAGFGLALFAVPLLTALGRTLPEAVALVIGAAVVQSSLSLWAAPERPPLVSALPMAACQWSGACAGVWAMHSLVAASPSALKAYVGALVVLLTSTQILLKPQPRSEVPRVWAGVAGLASGLLAGAVGMGGPPLVAYAMAHAWERDRFRTFLWTQFVLAAPVVVALLTYSFGHRTLWWVLTGAASLPFLWMGTRVGLALSSRWGRPQLMKVALSLLYLIGFGALLTPWLQA